MQNSAKKERDEKNCQGSSTLVPVKAIEEFMSFENMMIR